MSQSNEAGVAILVSHLTKDGFTLKNPSATSFDSSFAEIRNARGLAFEMSVPEPDRVNLTIHRHGTKPPEYTGDPGPKSMTIGRFFITTSGAKIWDENNLKKSLSEEELAEMNTLITSLLYFIKPNSAKFILE